MVKYINLTILILTMFSCKNKQDNESNIKTVNIEDLHIGSIVHESLSDNQLKNVKFIHETFNEVYPISLGETITNFKRDQNPDDEINIWLNMAQTYLIFKENNFSKEKLENRIEAFRLILMRTMMSDEEAISRSELNILTEVEIQSILNNYTLEAKLIKVVTE